MNNKAEGKTLLSLGGARHQVVALQVARELGCRTVLCDYLPDNPGQYEADRFYQVSTTDFDAVLDIARCENVDGVLAFGTDVALPTAGYVAETLGLPTNPLESIRDLSEKQRFRKTLARLGLPCPGFASFSSDTHAAEVAELLKELSYPLIIKPTDSSGSKGVTILDESDPALLERALEAARDYGRNGILVAEEFITQTYPHIVGGDIFVVDGTIVFWGLMRALRDEGLGGLVPVGEAYPSGLSPALEARVRHDLQALVDGLHLRFGEMNVEVLIGPDDTPYIIELAGRAGGNMIPLQLQDVSGIDLVRANVLCALGCDPGDLSFDHGTGAYATYMLHPSQEGTFVGVDVDERLRPHVYRQELFVEPGAHVERLTNSSQNIGIMYLRFDDVSAMEETLPKLGGLVRVRID